jgi:arylsulfatase
VARSRSGPTTGRSAKAPYAFTGTVKGVVFDLKPHAHADEHDLHQHAAHHAVAAGVAG